MMILNKLSKLSSLILCTSFIALTVICYLSAISLLVAQTAKPNVVVIFCDDLGYGDLGGFGHPTIQTPHLDKMAAEGQKWTSFYAAASVCTPSRAGLLTGRLPVRNGMASDKRRVLFPDSDKGLPPDEITIAEMLKPQGYATAAIGKWHLGHLPPYLPTRHGFDTYFGIPYSNDMDAVHGWDIPKIMNPKTEYWNVPLLRDEETIEQPANQTTITKRYTEEAVKFIRANRDQPFFLYLAHSMPHVPLFASQDFSGKSARGLYGDVIEEIDWSAGQIVKTLVAEGLDKNTLVVFTSDNGPWLLFEEQGGSAGLLHQGKGTTWEGGMRVPTIFWWPGKIEPAVINGMGVTLDLLPTIASLADASLPDEHIIDGVDLSPTLFNQQTSPRQDMYFYRGQRIFAYRTGAFKAHFITQLEYVPNAEPAFHNPPLLYNLDHDPGEQYDIAKEHPEIIAKIMNEVEAHRENMVIGEDQLASRIKTDE